MLYEWFEFVILNFFNTLLLNIYIVLGTDHQDEAVREVVDFMNTYSISQEDFDTIVELSKFKVVLPWLDRFG